MVVTEALARGLPVVATEVGGLPEALGQAADGAGPASWSRPGDSGRASRLTLRDWLRRLPLRRRLRQAARERRRDTAAWAVTASQILARPGGVAA